MVPVDARSKMMMPATKTALFNRMLSSSSLLNFPVLLKEPGFHFPAPTLLYQENMVKAWRKDDNSVAQGKGS
jgi:hypothetical protein